MQVVELSRLRAFDPTKMRKSNAFETRNFFCDLYCLEPGQSQAPHAHDGLRQGLRRPRGRRNIPRRDGATDARRRTRGPGPLRSATGSRTRDRSDWSASYSWRPIRSRPRRERHGRGRRCDVDGRADLHAGPEAVALVRPEDHAWLLDRMAAADLLVVGAGTIRAENPSVTVPQEWSQRRVAEDARRSPRAS